MNPGTVRFLKWLGIVAIALAVCYATLATFANRSLSRAYAALEADGRPTNLKEIVPPEIPDPDNAALVYRSVVLQLKSVKAQNAGEKNLWDALTEAAEGAIAEPINAESVEYFRQLYDRPAVAEVLAKVEAGSRKPGYSNDIDYSKGLYIELPHISELIGLSRILCAGARLQSTAGDEDAAWDSALTALRVANALEQEPVLLSQVTRAKQFTIAAKTIRALPYRAAARLEADALLGAAENLTPWMAAIDGERVFFGEWAFEIAYSSRGMLISEVQGLVGSQEKLSRSRLFLYGLVGPLTKFDHAAHLTVMHDYAREMLEPAFPTVSESRQQLLEELPWYCVITRSVAPSLRDIKLLRVDLAARIRVTRAGLALLQRREETGAWPDALLETSNVVDPYTGESLIYQPSSTGFVLYSVGRNLTDDKGWQGEEVEDGDIVWRFSVE